MRNAKRLERLEDKSPAKEDVEVMMVLWDSDSEEEKQNTMVTFTKPPRLQGTRITLAEFERLYPDGDFNIIHVSFVDKDMDMSDAREERETTFTPEKR